MALLKWGQRGWRAGSLFLLLAVLQFGGGARAAEPSREYQLKAVFLFNFAQFAEWPPESFADKDAPLVIGILGADPFGNFLTEMVRDEVVRGRRLVVERYQKLEEIKTCHILFISQSKAGELDQILEALKAKPVLTVSDIANSALRGVMIRFITEQNKIRFRINVEAVKASNLSLSSKLLRSAEIVTTEKK